MKCENECYDEDDQAKYLSSEFNVRNKRHLIPTVTRENNLYEILEPTKVSIYN